MHIGNLDTHSKALNNRVELQNNFGSLDLNQWVFNELQPFEGAICLDLGCGRGKQSLPLAQVIGEHGSLTSIDLSEESLQILKRDATQLKVDRRITFIHSELDALESFLGEKKFDRVVGSYSLYYVRNAQEMFSTIYQHLSTDGRLFFCGPSNKNNFELRTLIAGIMGDNSLLLEPTHASQFMETDSQEICSTLFSEINVITFENPVVFPDPKSVLIYWRSHNMFNKQIDASFETAILKHFDEHSQFINTKCALGICAKKI